MLEGLEVSIVNNISVKKESYSFRWDSEFFKKEFLFELFKMNSFKILSDICEIKSGTTPVDRNDNLKVGIVLLKTNDIRNNILLSEENYYFIDNKTNLKMKKTQLLPNDVLVNIVGATTNVIGRVAIINENFPTSNITQAMALCRIKTNEDYIAEYLFTFLTTSYGNKQVRRIARQTGQFNMNLIELGEFKIFKSSMIFQYQIKAIINKVYEFKKLSNDILINTEKYLFKEIGFTEWQPSLENKTIKKFSESYIRSERLDAEYYQPKYDELMKMIKKNKYATLSEIVQIKKSIEPGSDAYQTVGIPFLRVANISKYEISDTDIYLNEKEFNDKNLKPDKDTILFSKDGSVGIAYKLEENIDAITSSALLHLKVKDNNVLPDYLTLVLNSKLVQLQAERDSGGSIIQHWRKEEIENVLIPLLEMDKQIEISNEIKKSFTLRKQSKDLLERAKRAVEIAIEEGEEKALEYIKIS